MNFPESENKELLELYSNLRVCDIRDGMDWNKMQHNGSMSNQIRPLYRTRAIGIALTVRYLPYQEAAPKMTPDEYSDWVGWYYQEVCPYPWIDTITDGNFIVIDQSNLSVGLMGSHNTLVATSKGARGFVSGGGVRDTDEIIIQKIPFWSRYISQTMVQGRLKFDAFNIPVNVGGVMVYPGDVVAADGDGVIVVPRTLARDVAKYAHRELKSDKKNRRQLYEEMNIELDDTVK